MRRVHGVPAAWTRRGLTHRVSHFGVKTASLSIRFLVAEASGSIEEGTVKDSHDVFVELVDDIGSMAWRWVIYILGQSEVPCGQ